MSMKMNKNIQNNLNQINQFKVQNSIIQINKQMKTKIKRKATIKKIRDNNSKRRIKNLNIFKEIKMKLANQQE